MLIAVDASRATVRLRTGTEGYSLHIIRGLIALGSGHRFHLYMRDDPEPGLFPADRAVTVEVLRRPRLWTHTALGPAVRRQRPDVLFVPSHVLPWPSVQPVPAVVTIHDLGYRYYPEKHPLPERLYLNWSTRHSARAARRVIAVSHATAHDLTALDGVPAEKIRVVHSGIDPMLRPVEDAAQLARVRTRYGIPGPYVLHVGSIQPRKNLQRLVDAFDRVKGAVEGLSLVLAGRLSWGYQPILDRIAKRELADRVLLPGYVPDSDLTALYSGAAVYAFPSLYEGFGFPALEAMACGTPVVCANVSSLPELVNGAALTFAPPDVDAMAGALRRVLTDRALCEQLVRAGFERVERFTWDAAARKTLDVLEEAAGT
jgi:glycosyltransferase involved in cell wall biosynthesis